MLGASGDLLHDGDALAWWTAATLAAGLLAWHGLGLLVWLAARVWPERVALARAARLSPLWARRATGVMCGASLVLSAAIAHAADASIAPVSADEPFVRAPAAAATSTTSAPPVPAAPSPAPVPQPQQPQPAPSPPLPEPRTHVVQPGDNLWRIAAAELAHVTGDADPSDGEIVPYWHAVIDANRSTLRSGDPSLIYPGEIVALPRR